jgi:hypothetical protein
MTTATADRPAIGAPPAESSPAAATGLAALIGSRAAARAWAMLLTGALLFSVYLLSNSGRLHIVDEASLFAVTESLALRGQADTNAIAWTQWVNSPGEVLGAFGPDGEVYSKKGPAPAFLAVPWYLLLRGISALNVQLGLLQGTLLWNGVVTALTAILLWLTAVRLGYRDRTGLILALLFGLTTIAWPYAKQFFGEPVSAFALMLCFTGILHWKMSGRWGWMAAAGVGAAIAVSTVTAHAVILAIFGIYALLVMWQRRGDGWPALAAAAGALLIPLLIGGGFLLLYNGVRFGNPFDTGYHFDSGEGFTTPIWQGAWGLLFSPYRSVFLHTPLFVASLAAFVPFARRHRLEASIIAAASIALVALYSMWWMWWGGYAWGPRFLVPLTPLLVLPLAPVVESLVLRWSDGRAHGPAGMDEQASAQEPGRAMRLLGWLLIVTAALSLIVQLLAVSINFVNYETLLRAEFFPTDWENPLAYGPPAQALGDFLLSPVFGQLRLLARGGIAANSDLAWLWPNGKIAWSVIWVGLAAVATLGWQLVRWWRNQVEVERSVQTASHGELTAPQSGSHPRANGDYRLPNPPVLAMAALIPVLLTGAWLGSMGRDPLYGTPESGYQAVLQEICSADRPGDVLVNAVPFGYHIPMNWLAPLCGRALPVYGYALNSMEFPETAQVLGRVLGDSSRIFFVTAGVAPNDPENTIERWLAENAYKADDVWFDDHRLLRYATPGALEGVPFAPHELFLSDGGANRLTILDSRAPATVRSGAIVPVEIRYELDAQVPDDLRWFVQLLAPDGSAVAQLDSAPNDNYSPFSTLPVGEVITERVALQLPPDLPAGSYQLIAGVYNPVAEGAPRLRASDARQYLVLSTLAVTE